MKNIKTNGVSFAIAKLKAISAIALIAVIGFTFASCDDGTTGGGGVPDAPTGLTITVTSNTIQANWNTVTGATGYIFYISADNFTTFEKEQMTGTSYTENFTAAEIPAGTTLYFRVSAINAYGEGAKSDVVSKTIPSGSTTTYSLEGVWRDDDTGMIVTINGSTGNTTQFGSLNALGQSAIDKGFWKVCDPYFRNLTKTGDLTWTGQEVGSTFNTSAPNVATGVAWANCTITMNANGLTFQSSSSMGPGNFTRQQ